MACFHKRQAREALALAETREKASMALVRGGATGTGTDEGKLAVEWTE